MAQPGNKMTARELVLARRKAMSTVGKAALKNTSQPTPTRTAAPARATAAATASATAPAPAASYSTSARTPSNTSRAASMTRRLARKAADVVVTVHALSVKPV